MTARVDDLCDRAKERIEEAIQVHPFTFVDTVITVECDDCPQVDTTDLQPGRMLVFVSWAGWNDAGPASRGEDLRDYQLVFLIVEKCRDTPGGKVPLDWRRARSAWVDRCVIDALTDARNPLDGAYALQVDDVTIDRDELFERQTFWVGVVVTFRDCRESPEAED